MRRRVRRDGNERPATAVPGCYPTRRVEFRHVTATLGGPARNGLFALTRATQIVF